MCRGLALGYNTKTGEIICEGKSSHTKTLGEYEDDCIKLEIIVDDTQECKYSIELDEQYFKDGKLDKHIKDKFGKYLTVTGDMGKQLTKIVEDWVRDNEIKVLRYLLFCQSYKKAKSTINNISQCSDFIYNSYQLTHFIYNDSQHAEFNIFNNNQQAGEFIYNNGQNAKKEIYVSHIINHDKEVDDFIKMLSNQETSLTWKTLVRLAIKGYEAKGV